MIVGLGTDIVGIARIEGAVRRRGERILRRLFTEGERAYCESRARPAEHFAARFAAKEAVMKALGTGWRAGIGWGDIEVVREPSGRPTLRLRGRAAARAADLDAATLHLTLSHDDAYAVAVVVLERD